MHYFLTSESTATPGPDTIDGTNADETFDGGDGNDIINGHGGNDALYGNIGNDILYGEEGDDTLDGGQGDDTLDGGTGADVLIGGTGNDNYYIRDAKTSIIELGGADNGFDIAYIFIPIFKLQENVGIEVMQAEIDAAVTLVGNSLNNTIIGGAHNDVLSGGAGNDQLVGNGGDDVLDGGPGVDTLDGGTGNDTYYVDNPGDIIVDSDGLDTVLAETSYSLANAPTVENLTGIGKGAVWLTGNALANVIIGTDFNDTLDGGTGADLLQGGSGNDTYIIDNPKDIIVDSSGIDTVLTSISYRLPSNVENIFATGSASISLKGNDSSNRVVGNAGNNTLDGGLGQDILMGGAGKDVFLFDSHVLKKKNLNIDIITDFSSKQKDHVWLDNKIFTKLGKKGTLAKPAPLADKAFYTGAHAHDADDRIIYNKKTGALYYDPDGTGHEKAIEIAILQNKAKLSEKDIWIV